MPVENGRECLVCFYDAELKNWDEAIEEARKKHGTNKATILCLPTKKEKKWMKHGQNKLRKRISGKG